ncbi:hypothetical protein AY599_10665 [Leptolyngbya valderiana BDU 20041]|nr:hypothetical protein AY599_10665 [Leptolyngbya valderiana BDU 20041]PPT09762.1 Serine/threonine protein kinase [Geitlerinema sp. FC II]
MRQLSSTEFAPVATKPSLNPALQMALGSLDVRLDNELERYRLAAKRFKSVPSRTPVSPPSVKIVEGRLAPTPSPSVSTSETASDTPPSNPTPLPEQVELPTPDGTSTPPQNLADDTPATNLPPQDYLESSEQLLESQIEPVDETSKERSAKSLMTPLGVGSILLFLAASATLGYVLANPDSLDRLGFDRLFGRDTNGEAETTPTDTSESDTADDPPRLPASPDLASEEFVELDLNTLSGLDPEVDVPIPPPTSARPAPQTPPQGSQAQGTTPQENTLDNISALLAPKSNPPADEAENTSDAAEETTVETDANAEPRPEPAISQNDDYYGFYFVLVDYNGNVATLDRVREVVPDAYLREFPSGTKVQVAALDDRASAEDFAETLEREGISAEVWADN